MHILSYTPDPNNPHDQASITISVPPGSNLKTVLTAMEGYLLACGFVIDGSLDVVEEDAEGRHSSKDICLDPAYPGMPLPFCAALERSTANTIK